MTYVKTKSGKIFKVWSDNVAEETMHVYPVDEVFYADSTSCDEIPYSDIVATDTNVYALNPDYKF